MRSAKYTTGFIGAGKVATALGKALHRKGYPVTAAGSRSFSSAVGLEKHIPGCKAVRLPQEVADACELVFITTPDSAVAQVAGSIKWKPGQMVVHTSGADSAAILEPASRQGALTGVFHPLQTLLCSGFDPKPFKGITVTIEAGNPLLEVLSGIAYDLEATPLELGPEARVLYHASAVMVSNYTISLMSLACRLWERFGYDRHTAIKSLVPLLKETLTNIEHTGLPGCLTGPVSRGDLDTIAKHVEALGGIDPLLSDTYRSLGLATVDIAREKGSISPARAEEITTVLNDRSDYVKNDVKK